MLKRHSDDVKRYSDHKNEELKSRCDLGWSSHLNKMKEKTKNKDDKSRSKKNRILMKLIKLVEALFYAILEN